MRKGSYLISILIFLSCASCNTIYHPQSAQYINYKVSSRPVTDSSIVHLIAPYRAELNRSMNEVIAEVGVVLRKEQPEGSLGNLMADVMLISARKKYDRAVDVALMNFGGIRLTEIAPGPLTRGKVFELSPFDNYVVLLTMNGMLLKQFLDHVAGRGGWPVAGMTMKLVNGKSSDVLIGGKPLDLAAQYTVAVLDYTANGGDESYMLKELKQQNNGLLLRDQLIEYFSDQQRQGKKIVASVEGRVTKG